MKLERARQFIDELKCAAERYKNSHPLTGTVLPERGVMDLRWEGIGLLPGAIVGDAIHNMRTALDLMASELARLNGKDDSNVYFPFAHNADGIDDAIKRRRFHYAGEDAIALLKTFAPYSGGNEALRAIHDLDISDKHTALIPAASTMRVQADTSYNIDTGEAHHLKIALVDFSFVFPQGKPFGGNKIVETLEELVRLVEGVIDAFAEMVCNRESR